MNDEGVAEGAPLVVAIDSAAIAEGEVEVVNADAEEVVLAATDVVELGEALIELEEVDKVVEELAADDTSAFGFATRKTALSVVH